MSRRKRPTPTAAEGLPTEIADQLRKVATLAARLRRWVQRQDSLNSDCKVAVVVACQIGLRISRTPGWTLDRLEAEVDLFSEAVALATRMPRLHVITGTTVQ